MTTPPPVPGVLGRGAWTTTGMPHGATNGNYEMKHPMVGRHIYTEDVDDDQAAISWRAVYLGVIAIQNLLHVPPLGLFNAATQNAVIGYQQIHGLVDDGSVGPVTAKVMFSHLILEIDVIHGSLLCGIAQQESDWDPGAVGFFTPDDKGLVQWNLPSSGFTNAQAFDPVYAIDRATTRFETSWNAFKGKGMKLREQCAIAQWNSPLWAAQWFTHGEAPNVEIATYVQHVQTNALDFV